MDGFGIRWMCTCGFLHFFKRSLIVSGFDQAECIGGVGYHKAYAFVFIPGPEPVPLTLLIHPNTLHTRFLYKVTADD